MNLDEFAAYKATHSIGSVPVQDVEDNHRPSADLSARRGQDYRQDAKASRLTGVKLLPGVVDRKTGRVVGGSISQEIVPGMICPVQGFENPDSLNAFGVDVEEGAEPSMISPVRGTFFTVGIPSHSASRVRSLRTTSYFVAPEAIQAYFGMIEAIPTPTWDEVDTPYINATELPIVVEAG